MPSKRIKAHVVAGITGMLLVSALYGTDEFLLTSGRGDLSPFWLLLLLLPGALAGYLSRDGATEREGLLAGLLTAHFAATLQICMLIYAVLTVDWQRYGGEVGDNVAAAVRDAAWPVAAVAGVVLIIVTYVYCMLAGWLGALFYRQCADAVNRLMSSGRREGR